MKIKITFYIFVLAFAKGVAQDHSFINSNQSLVNLNPSFAGSNGFIRNQFSSSDANYFTSYANSFDAYIKPLKAGVAVSATMNNFSDGIYKNNYISLSYAQYFSLLGGQLKIIPSLRLSYAENLLDLHRAGYDDPNINWWYGEKPASQKTYLNLGSGLLVSYKNKLFVGFSVSYLNRPNVSLYDNSRISMFVNYHLSYNLKISEGMQLQFFEGIQIQGTYRLIKTAINLVTFNHVITGLGINLFESQFLNLGYRNNYFSIVAGYSFYIRNEKNASASNIELHASFNLRSKEQRKVLTSFETW